MEKKTSIGLIIMTFVIVIIILFASISLAAEDTNAANVYRKASSMLTSFYKEVYSTLTKMPGKFPENYQDYIVKREKIIKNGWVEDNEEFKEILTSNQEAINEFKKATKIKNCSFTFEESVKENLNAPLLLYFYEDELVELVMLQARLYERENKWDLALDNYLSILRFTNHLGQQKESIYYSKGSEISRQAITFLPLMQYINRKDISIQECQILLDYLLFIRNNKTGLEEALEEAKKDWKNTIRASYCDIGHKTQHEDTFYQELCKEFNKIADEFYEYLIICFKDNRPEKFIQKLNQFKNELEKEIKPLSLSWESLKSINSPSLRAKIIFSLGVHDVHARRISHYYITLSELNILITSVAIKLFELQNGKLPDSLPELVPVYLSKLPEDPFDDFKPLKYKKKDNKWVVYSFGPNRKDDGAGVSFDTGKFFSGSEDAGDIFFPNLSSPTSTTKEQFK